MKTDPCKSIPNSMSPSESWVNWHKSLLKWFSKEEANQHWIRFWSQRAGGGTPADTHSLRDYMRTQDVDLTTDLSGAIRDKLENVSDWFGDTFNGIRAIFLGAVILALALIAFYFIRSINKAKQLSELSSDIRVMRSSKILPKTTPSIELGAANNQFYPLGTQTRLK